MYRLSLIIVLCLPFLAQAGKTAAEVEYIEMVMKQPLWLPADLKNDEFSCNQATASTSGPYLSSSQVNYPQNDWESRISADWQYFDSPAQLGKVLVIDIDSSAEQPTYRYLSNGTQTQLFEPWSSSKVFAYASAMAKLRKEHQVGGDGYLGQFNIADLITSIHSYAPHGTADGDSNAIASYFVNMAGRDATTRLFHKNWLNLADAHIVFGGGYAVKLLNPEPAAWLPAVTSNELTNYSVFDKNGDDPGYLSYRCPSCGLTGNKPMSTLAIAEYLKRLAMHDLDEATQHPHLQKTDLDVLFSGKGHTDKDLKTAGMMRGISLQLGIAIARAISGNPELDDKAAEEVLNQSTNGKWRIYQKIGWGPSETRGRGENVMLAQVCLPMADKTASFTIAAQAFYPKPEEASVWQSGIKMQRLLDNTMFKLLNVEGKK